MGSIRTMFTNSGSSWSSDTDSHFGNFDNQFILMMVPILAKIAHFLQIDFIYQTFGTTASLGIVVLRSLVK